MTIDIAEPFARRQRDAPPRQNPTSHSGPNKFHTAQGRLWVNRYRNGLSARRPLIPQQRRYSGHSGTSSLCQTQTSLAPSFTVK